MLNVNTLSFIALCCSISGNLFINFRKRIGFIVWIISNVLWIAVNFMQSFNISQVAMFVMYIGLSIHGYATWAKKK